MPRHPTDGPNEADRCTFCAHPRAKCDKWLAADPRTPCCVKCSHKVVVHRLPPNGVGVTPCCGKTPFELPRTDQITAKGKITCTSQNDPHQPEGS